MSEKKEYRVFVVDDHPIVRDGIIGIIESNKCFKVCGQTGDGNEVLKLVSSSKPDIIILDLTLGASDGFALIGQINSRFSEIPILILSMHSELTHAQRSIKAGAHGYLMKKCASREIITALTEILHGRIYVSESVKEQLLLSFVTSRNDSANPLDTLSPREFQIYRLYGQGLQTACIANTLHCSPKTIETHCLRIRRKLNLNNLNELIANASAYMNLS